MPKKKSDSREDLLQKAISNAKVQTKVQSKTPAKPQVVSAKTKTDITNYQTKSKANITKTKTDIANYQTKSKPEEKASTPNLFQSEFTSFKKETIEILEELKKENRELKETQKLPTTFPDQLKDRVRSEFPLNHEPEDPERDELIVSVIGKDATFQELKWYRTVVNAYYRRERESFHKKVVATCENYFYKSKRDEISIWSSSDIQSLINDIETHFSNILPLLTNGRNATSDETKFGKLQIEEWLKQESGIFKYLEGEGPNICSTNGLKKRSCDREKKLEEAGMERA